MKYNINGYEYKMEYGKNRYENWRLIEEAEEVDYWLHVDEYPSTHVIIEYNEKVDEHVLKYGAQLCVNKTNSIKKDSKVNVICTNVSNIRKGKSVGEVFIKEMSNVKYIRIKK